MLKRAAAVLLVLAVPLMQTECYVRKIQPEPPQKVPQPQTEKIIGITTMKGEDVSFDRPGAAIRGNTLYASVKKTPYEISLDQVQRFWIEHRELSKWRTYGLVAAVGLGILIAASPKGGGGGSSGSCPFVYSWDGTQYVFDAEPYGGAISRGLEKDDYTPLDHLRRDNGLYRLKIMNEVDETQFTNVAELWIVDHPAGTRVAADMQGNLYTLEASESLVSARDQLGHDLLPWLRATDRLIWEPSTVADSHGNLKDNIVMTFPKPAGAKRAKLVANVATGLWGSYMVRKMVELRGRDISSWYTLMDESANARDALFAWELREGLYALRIYVEEPTGWEPRGILTGLGPLISQDRVVPLDVSRVQGNQLRIRIHPTTGFWAFNSFAVDYSSDRAMKVVRVAPSTAWDSQGNNVLPELVASDDRYFAMPNIGDFADLTFPAPRQHPGTDRNVLLHSRGYYRLHLAENSDPNRAILDEVENVEGAAGRYAANQFAQWQTRGKPANKGN